MEPCHCTPVEIEALKPGDIYHNSAPGEQVIYEMIEEGRASGDRVFEHNETLFFTVDSINVDGDRLIITHRNGAGDAIWDGVRPFKTFLVSHQG